MITLPDIIPASCRKIKKGGVLYVEKNGTTQAEVTHMMRAVAGMFPSQQTSYQCSFKPDVFKKFGKTVVERMGPKIMKRITDDAPLVRLIEKLKCGYGYGDTEFSELLGKQDLELNQTESQYVAVVMCAAHYREVDLIVMDMPEIIGGGYTFMIFDELEAFARETNTPMVISRSVYRGTPGQIQFTQVSTAGGNVN